MPSDYVFEPLALAGMFAEPRLAAKNEILQKPVRSLVNNLARASAVVSLPAVSFATAMVDERCRCIAELRLTGSVEIPHAMPPHLMPKGVEECRRLRGEWSAHPDYADRFLAQIQFAAKEINALVSALDKSDAFQIAVDATLSSGLIGIWTVFETFATDVWVEAVNSRPMSLGEKALLAPKPHVEDGEPIFPRGDSAEKRPDSVKLDLLRKHGYNLSNSLGTIMERNGKFKFSRLQGIRQAYIAVWGDPVKAIFQTYDDLKFLEAVRNVLVHRGGIVDKPFKERVKNDPVLSKLAEDDALPVDSAMLSRFTKGVRGCTGDLLAFVDSWLSDNPA